MSQSYSMERMWDARRVLRQTVASGCSQGPVIRVGITAEAVGCVLRTEPPACEHSAEESEEGGAWSTAAGGAPNPARPAPTARGF